MADIYLGLAGAEILLPPIRRVGSFDASIPIEYEKQIDEATMLDGSRRFNFREHHPRRWGPLEWEAVTAAELANFLLLNGYEEALRFQNNWEDATWHEVVITDFRYPINVKMSCAGDSRFDVSMTLKEVIG